MLLHVIRNKTLERCQFLGVSGLGRAPGVGKKCRSSIRESAGVHAGAIPDALAVAVKNAPDIRMAGARSVGQVEYAVLLKGQTGVDRVPLDPRLQVHRIEVISLSDEDLRTVMEALEVRQVPAGHPCVKQARSKLVEFDQNDSCHVTNSLKRVQSPVHMPWYGPSITAAGTARKCHHDHSATRSSFGYNLSIASQGDDREWQAVSTQQSWRCRKFVTKTVR